MILIIVQRTMASWWADRVDNGPAAVGLGSSAGAVDEGRVRQ
ncbi:hypothetical protein ACX80V_09145 [Arthrobacter sp. MDT3-24]